MYRISVDDLRRLNVHMLSVTDPEAFRGLHQAIQNLYWDFPDRGFTAVGREINALASRINTAVRMMRGVVEKSEERRSSLHVLRDEGVYLKTVPISSKTLEMIVGLIDATDQLGRSLGHVSLFCSRQTATPGQLARYANLITGMIDEARRSLDQQMESIGKLQADLQQYLVRATGSSAAQWVVNERGNLVALDQG